MKAETEKTLIRIDFENGILKTENHTYRIAESMSQERYEQFELLQLEFAYGFTFTELQNILTDIEKKFNTMNIVEAATLIYNLKNSVKNGIEKRIQPYMRLCGLILIREDEDITVFNELFQKEKINDLMKAGVDYRDFFALAMNLIPSLLQVYKEISQTTIKEGMELIKNQLFKATESEK